jgi:hypothetical protein
MQFSRKATNNDQQQPSSNRKIKPDTIIINKSDFQELLSEMIGRYNVSMQQRGIPWIRGSIYHGKEVRYAMGKGFDFLTLSPPLCCIETLYLPIISDSSSWKSLLFIIIVSGFIFRY